MKLTNEPLLLEAYGARLYTHFCAECGKTEMSETEALHEIRCGNCGHDKIRLIRDTAAERLLMARSGTLQ